MLSIIICSRYKVLDRALQENIQKTIGCEYEIIHIDNSEGNYNIYQAYNIGVTQAQGDILCFMHEDVRFHSSDWGTLSCTYLKNKEIGAIGVAGSYAVLTHGDWRMYGLAEIYLRQGTYAISKEREYYCYPPRKKISNLREVAVLDGVWYCIRKDLFEKISYDEQSYSGFHLYDSDICMQINMLNLSIMLCPNIDIEHYSIGMYTQGFQDNLNIFLRKWNDVLPYIKVLNLTDADIKQLEDKGTTQLEVCIKKDKIRMSLYDSFQQNKDTQDLTMEEKQIVRESLYNYVRWSIKNRDYSFKQSFAIYRKYLLSKQLKRPMMLFLKLLFYKVKNNLVG